MFNAAKQEDLVSLKANLSSHSTFTRAEQAVLLRQNFALDASQTSFLLEQILALFRPSCDLA